MSRIRDILNNDEGYIIIAAILILVILTIAGISATTNSSSESQITSNYQVHKMAFYAAESGWQRASVYLQDQYPLITVDSGSDISGGAANFDMTPGRFADPDEFPIPNTNDKEYSVSARFDGADYAPGWDITLFRRYLYSITSTGNYPGTGVSNKTATSSIKVSGGKIGQM
jgi:hypothetical protein